MPKKLPTRRKRPPPAVAEQPAAAPPQPAPKINASDLSGLKYFNQIRPLLESLHGEEKGSGAELADWEAWRIIHPT